MKSLILDSNKSKLLCNSFSFSLAKNPQSAYKLYSIVEESILGAFCLTQYL